MFLIAPVILIALTLFAIHPAGQRPSDGGPNASIGLPLSVGASAQANIRAGFAALPLAFEQNQGQTDSQVKYLARGSGYTVFLTATDTAGDFTYNVQRMSIAVTPTVDQNVLEVFHVAPALPLHVRVAA